MIGGTKKVTDDQILHQLKVTEADKKAQEENKAKRKASREIRKQDQEKQKKRPRRKTVEEDGREEK